MYEPKSSRGPYNSITAAQYRSRATALQPPHNLLTKGPAITKYSDVGDIWKYKTNHNQITNRLALIASYHIISSHNYDFYKLQNWLWTYLELTYSHHSRRQHIQMGTDMKRMNLQLHTLSCQNTQGTLKLKQLIKLAVSFRVNKYSWAAIKNAHFKGNKAF